MQKDANIGGKIQKHNARQGGVRWRPCGGKLTLRTHKAYNNTSKNTGQERGGQASLRRAQNRGVVRRQGERCLAHRKLLSTVTEAKPCTITATQTEQQTEA